MHELPILPPASQRERERERGGWERDRLFHRSGRRTVRSGIMVAITSTSSTPSSLSPQPHGSPLNIPLISAFLACIIAQFLKLFTNWYKENTWDARRVLGSGGMPSSHSATVTALAMSIGLRDGLGGSVFAVAIALACVVMYDASGVRLHAGRHAELLNQIVCAYPPEHPLSTSRPLLDSLGHTPFQVIVGAVLGCLVAFLIKYCY